MLICLICLRRNSKSGSPVVVIAAELLEHWLKVLACTENECAMAWERFASCGAPGAWLNDFRTIAALYGLFCIQRARGKSPASYANLLVEWTECRLGGLEEAIGRRFDHVTADFMNDFVEKAEYLALQSEYSDNGQILAAAYAAVYGVHMAEAARSFAYEECEGALISGYRCGRDVAELDAKFADGRTTVLRVHVSLAPEGFVCKRALGTRKDILL